MKNLIVMGRHVEGRFDRKNIVSNFAVHEEGVTLRLDDKANLAWWLEIDIPKEVLEDLLNQINEKQKETITG